MSNHSYPGRRPGILRVDKVFNNPQRKGAAHRKVIGNLGSLFHTKKIYFDGRTKTLVEEFTNPDFTAKDYLKMQMNYQYIDIAFNTGIYLRDRAGETCYQDLRKNPTVEYCDAYFNGRNLDTVKTPAVLSDKDERYSIVLPNDLRDSPESRSSLVGKMSIIPRESSEFKKYSSELDEIRDMIIQAATEQPRRPRR